MIINPTKTKIQIKNNLYNPFNRALCILALFLMAIVFIPTNNSISYATSIDQQIQDTTNSLNNKKVESRTLASEVASFDSQIQSLESKVWATQTEMNNLTSQIDSLNKQIAENESSLKIQKETLNEYMRVIYEESNTSTLELVASADNFSDFVDKTEYLQTMQIKVKDMVENIKKLREELEQKKKDLVAQKDKVVNLSKQQNLQKRAVDNQQAAKANLLATSKGQENVYKQQLSSLYTQRANLSRIYNEGGGTVSGGAAGGGVITSGGTGSYPWANEVPDAYADNWRFYIRECTSYVAWYSASHGPVSSADLYTWGGIVPTNGEHFAARARNSGYPVDSNPRVGDIMVFPSWSVPSVGHVAIVKAVNSDNTVWVGEYNYYSPYNYDESRKVVNAANYGATFIHPK